MRNVIFMGLTSFLTDTTSKMIYSIMPMFLMSLGASKTQLSLIEGIAESTASLLKAMSGWWSDRIGRNKPFMIIGYAFTAVMSPLFSLAANPLQVLAIRFTERVGKGIRTAPRDSLVAASSSEGTKGRSLGFTRRWTAPEPSSGRCWCGVLASGAVQNSVLNRWDQRLWACA